jgi:hypothetical protein
VELDLALVGLRDHDRVAELDDLVVDELLERGEGVIGGVAVLVLDHEEAVLIRHGSILLVRFRLGDRR